MEKYSQVRDVLTIHIAEPAGFLAMIWTLVNLLGWWMKTFWGRHKCWAKNFVWMSELMFISCQWDTSITWLSTMFCTSCHCHLSGGRNLGDEYLEIQISGSLVILWPLPGAGLNMSIKGKGVVLFHGMPPFALELSWSSCCPPWCSQPSSSARAQCPGAQMEQPLPPASVACIWLHIKIWPDFVEGSAQWCVSLTQSLLSLLPEMA